MALLAEAALRVTVLALGVAAVLRVLRLRSPRLRHTAWTSVVVTMLLMPAILKRGPRLDVPCCPVTRAAASWWRSSTPLCRPHRTLYAQAPRPQRP